MGTDKLGLSAWVETTGVYYVEHDRTKVADQRSRHTASNLRKSFFFFPRIIRGGAKGR